MRGPRWWNEPETLVCGVRGHVVPVAGAGATLPEHEAIVTTTVDGHRFGRCLRCDCWIPVGEPEAGRDGVPPLERLDLPRRGRALRDAMIVRFIAVERAVHAVVFAIAAIGLYVLDADLAGLQGQARHLIDGVDSGGLGAPGQTASRDVIVRQLNRLLNIHSHTLAVLAVTSAIYCVVEGVEAVGLWHERRWAEYLTAAATAGFLPFEIHELIKRVTVVRTGALVVNGAILAWLVWRKQLFGVGRLRSLAAGRRATGVAAAEAAPDRLAPFRMPATSPSPRSVARED